MANNGVSPGGNLFPYSPSYGVVDGIPTIVIEGTPLKHFSAWDYIVSAAIRAKNAVTSAVPSFTLTPDEANKTPQPTNPASALAPLLAIGLAAAAGYFLWKGMK